MASVVAKPRRGRSHDGKHTHTGKHERVQAHSRLRAMRSQAGVRRAHACSHTCRHAQSHTRACAPAHARGWLRSRLRSWSQASARASHERAIMGTRVRGHMHVQAVQARAEHVRARRSAGTRKHGCTLACVVLASVGMQITRVAQRKRAGVHASTHAGGMHDG